MVDRTHEKVCAVSTAEVTRMILFELDCTYGYRATRNLETALSASILEVSDA